MRSVKYILFGIGFGTVTVALIASSIDFSSISSEVLFGGLTALLATLGSSVTFAISKSLEKEKERKELHRKEKTALYEKFISGLITYFMDSDQKKKLSSLLATFKELKSKILLWGGPDVVNAFLDWNEAVTSGDHGLNSFDVSNSLILAMRRELGHEDSAVREQEHMFVRLIVNDSRRLISYRKLHPEADLNEIIENISKERA